MFGKALISGILIVALAGCSGIPDIRRARQDATSGNIAAAKTQLEELARFGIADAQIELGDLYADEDSETEQAKALHWYRQAAQQGSDQAWLRLGKFLARSGKTHRQRRQGEQYLKKALVEGNNSALMPLITLYLDYAPEFPEAEPEKWIARARFEGIPEGDLVLARYYLITGQLDGRGGEVISLCEPIVKTQPGCLSILGRVYLAQHRKKEFDALVNDARNAWKDGSISDRDLYLFARWASSDESPVKQVAVSNNLYQLLIPDYAPAMTARARLIMDNPYLADASEVIGLLEASRAKGDLKASLTLARLYERGRMVPLSPEKAIKYALEAREKYPSADYLLGRIYQRGYLGEAEPEKAKEYLLSAARRGFPKADYLMAVMFWEGKGIEVDKEYAWAFALLAYDSGVARAKDLLLEMVPVMPHSLELKAEEIANIEKAARQKLAATSVTNSGSYTIQGG